MIPIMDFQERSLKGPVMKSTQFDLAFAKKVRELVGKYEIKYNPEELIVDDRTVEAGDLGTKGGLKTDASEGVERGGRSDSRPLRDRKLLWLGNGANLPGGRVHDWPGHDLRIHSRPRRYPHLNGSRTPREALAYPS
jgi:hypothetical protein